MKEVKEKTVLMISHRMRMTQKMDRIVVMKEGQIVEDESYERYIEKGRAF